MGEWTREPPPHTWESNKLGGNSAQGCSWRTPVPTLGRVNSVCRQQRTSLPSLLLLLLSSPFIPLFPFNNHVLLHFLFFTPTFQSCIFFPLLFTSYYFTFLPLLLFLSSCFHISHIHLALGSAALLHSFWHLLTALQSLLQVRQTRGLVQLPRLRKPFGAGKVYYVSYGSDFNMLLIAITSHHIWSSVPVGRLSTVDIIFL